MSREVTRRLLITLGLLSAFLLLRQIPVPGTADFPTQTWPGPVNLTAQLRLGGSGIANYLIASVLVILCRFFLGRRDLLEDETPALERQTLILAGVFVAMEMTGIGVFLFHSEWNVGFPLLPGPVALLVVTQVAAFYLIVWLARTISRHGIGNGVCWILLLGRLADLPLSPGSFAAPGSPESAEARAAWLIGIAALITVVPALSVTLLRARRSWRLVSPGGEREVRLPFLGVGVGGLALALSILTMVKPSVSFLPRDSALADRLFDPPAVVYSLVYFLIAVFGTLFLTAWTWRPDGGNLVRAPGASAAGFEFRRYGRTMVAAILPVALGLAAARALVMIPRREAHGWNCFDPMTILPICAIALSLLFQFRLHLQMARGAGAAHPEVEAFGACVICGRRLCERCGRPGRDRCLCPDHVNVELIEGWATVEVARTRLEAGRRRDHLREAGIRSLVLSNTIDPIYGTLDLFALNGVIPFFAHREIGGGRIRLMVHARDWARAVERLDQPMPGGGRPSFALPPTSSSARPTPDGGSTC